MTVFVCIRPMISGDIIADANPLIAIPIPLASTHSVQNFSPLIGCGCDVIVFLVVPSTLAAQRIRIDAARIRLSARPEGAKAAA
jgi:hypothetical protein